MPVNERNTETERLCKTNERVVNCAVTVGVQLAHDFANYAGTLDVASLGTQSHVGHLVNDSALDGL